MRPVLCAASFLLGLVVCSPAQAQETFNGSSGVLTPDGRFLAHLGPGLHGSAVIVRDLQAGTSRVVSVTNDGREGSGDVGVAAEASPRNGPQITISDDGQVVAFTASMPLVGDDHDETLDVYTRDLADGLTRRISVGLGGAPADGPSWGPRLSGDGRYLAFVSSASNLVAGDTNGVADVFVYSRVTGSIERVSVGSDGAQGALASIRPAISRDGSVVAFVSAAAPNLEQARCYGLGYPEDPPCPQVLVRDRLAGVTTSASTASMQVAWVIADVSADGRVVAGLGEVTIPGHHYRTRYFVRDRVSGTLLVDGADSTPPQRGSFLDLSADGGYLARGPNLRPGADDSPLATSLIAIDRGGRPDTNRRLDETIRSVPLESCSQFVCGDLIALSGDGMLLAVETRIAAVPSLVLHRRDADADGMLDVWERIVGLNPASPDGAADDDLDGRSNATEYARGGHPRGGVFRYLAESADNAWFDTSYEVFNPNASGALVTIRYEADGTRWDAGEVFALAGGYRATIGAAPSWLGSFAAIVESSQPLVVERRTTWDASAFGSSGETALAAPSTFWAFAEGATGGSFELFYLLANPGETAANVDVRYLRPYPDPPIVRSHVVPAHSRVTIHVDGEGPELAAADVGAVLRSDQPILAERALYLSTAGQLFAAGHVAAGTAAPAPRWFLAEGATGPFFDTFLLVVNTGATPTRVRVTYRLPDGAAVVKEHDVAGWSRRTIAVDDEDDRLANTPVAAVVESVDGTPIVVERAMWWPSGGWYEGHASAGVAAPARRWAFASVEIGGVRDDEPYVLIFNTSDQPGTVTVTALRTVNPERVVAVPPQSRTTVSLASLYPALVDGGAFSLLVESGDVDLVVERAVYSNAGGVTWAAGTAVTATPLP
jgi:Tol biopolymer transport system component